MLLRINLAHASTSLIIMKTLLNLHYNLSNYENEYRKLVPEQLYTERHFGQCFKSTGPFSSTC